MARVQKELYSPTEFMEKCTREGGFYDGLIYGLDETDLTEENPKFNALIKEAKQASRIIERCQEMACDLIDYED